MDLKVSLPIATAFVIVGILVSGFTKIWLWPAGLIGLGITTLLFSFKFNRVGFILLGVSCLLLIIALIFYSGWLLPQTTPQ